MKTLVRVVLAVLVIAATSAFALDVTITDSQTGKTASDSQTGASDSQVSAGGKDISGQTVAGESLTKITPVKAAFVAGQVAKAFVSKYFQFEPTIVKEYIEVLVKEIVYETIKEIVYVDRIVTVEKIVEKIVYVEVPKECKETCITEKTMKRIFVKRPDVTVTKSLLVKGPDGNFVKFPALVTKDWYDMGLYPESTSLNTIIFSSPSNGDVPSDKCLIYRESSETDDGIWYVEDSTIRDKNGNLRLDPNRLDFSDNTGYDALVKVTYEEVTVDCN